MDSLSIVWVSMFLVGIPCNTAHSPEIFDVILNGLNEINNKIKVLHMIDEVGVFVQQNYPEIKNIGILSTIGTSKTKVYPVCLGKYNIKTIDQPVIDIRKNNSNFIVSTEKQRFETKTVILATGTEKRKLNLKNEENFIGKGICYCYICENKSCVSQSHYAIALLTNFVEEDHYIANCIVNVVRIQ